MAGKYALLIGSSSFGEGGPPALAATETDVMALQAVLTDPAIAGFDPGDVRFSLNAGIGETQDAISWLFADRRAEDFLLLYYTGHGLKDARDGELYLALTGTQVKDPAPRSLLATTVKRQIRLSPSKRKLVILDCCHSAAFGLEGAMKIAQLPEKGEVEDLGRLDCEEEGIVAALATRRCMRKRRCGLRSGGPDEVRPG